jgi:hypothetical protein
VHRALPQGLQEELPEALLALPMELRHCDEPMRCRLQYLQQWDEQPWLVADQNSL